MSEAARAEREAKRTWAEPGSRHDRVVGVAKRALPVAAGLVGAMLVLAPFDRVGDVSFILDKNEVESAPERMRVDAAHYRGEDDQGQAFQIEADRAIQQTSDEPIVVINGMRARLDLLRGPLSIEALQGRYDLDHARIYVDGPVKVVGPDGYRIETRDVRINLNNRQLTRSGPVSGMTRLGPFEAQGLRADLGERTVTLEGRARLKIVQGTVR